MKKKAFLICICILLLIVGIVPYLWASLYAIPAIDDLTNAYRIRDYGEISYLSGVLRFANDIYFGWQGTYSSNLLIALIRPYDFWGMKGLRLYSAFLIIMLVLFFALSAFYIFKLFANDKIMLIISAIFVGLYILVISFEIRPNTDFLFFNTSTYVYAIPMSFGLISLSLFFNAFLSTFVRNRGVSDSRDKSTRLKNFVSIVFGIIACGGSLQISAIMCCVSMIAVLISICRNKKFKEKEVVYFLIMLISSCINAFAPGGFVRAGNDGSGLSIKRLAMAVFYAFYDVLLELRHIVFDSYFVFYLLIFFLIMCFVDVDAINLRLNLMTTVIAMIVVSVISIFPVVLGHNSAYLDDRNRTVLDMIIVICSLLCTGAVYNELKYNNVDTKKLIGVISLIVVVGIISYNQGYRFVNQPSISAYHQLLNGKVSQYSRDMEVVFNYLDDSKGRVEVPPVHCEQDVIYKLEFRENPEYWVNEGTANYFKLDSLRLGEGLEVNDLREMGY